MNYSMNTGHCSSSLMILAFLLFLPDTANGQEPAAPAEATIQTVGMQGGKYGIFGVLTSYGGRGWYRFDLNENYDFYGYGSLSILQHRYSRFGGGTESVMGLGGGVGVESSLQKIFDDEDFLPLNVCFK